MKKYCFFVLFLAFTRLYSQIPTGYYDSTIGLHREDLKTALYNIIRIGHTQNTYSSLWLHFQSTDVAPNGKVWDKYSNCNFTFVVNQCGNYSSECDCYNREHSTPASWFNDGYPMYADLFHLFPTDGWVNNRRGNFPFGQVGTATYTSGNGGKLGASNFPGYSGTVFEPIDTYKGDFARSVFYMSTRYQNVNTNWHTNSTQAAQVFTNNIFPGLTEWSRNLYLLWHTIDPVSQKEVMRNNAVFAIQGNRNPFIDDPNFAFRIWAIDANIDENNSNFTVSVYPNPFNESFTVSSINNITKIEVYDIYGRLINSFYPNNFVFEYNLKDIKNGIYMLKATNSNQQTLTTKIIKN